jgi:ribosome-associated heat shock protein Hsp15
METVRIDKWLWAARFYKTRSLASQAVNGGHVALGGNRVKPSREVRSGDQLVIRLNQLEYTVLVLAVSDKRGPATVARTLYAETEDSVAKRERQQEERKALRQLAGQPDHRPDKHERRKIRQFLKKDYE